MKIGQYEIKAWANLQGANLQGANLQGANLQGANLQGANLRYANLRYANFQGADLYGANLRGANLQGANLQGANLYGADLYRADLYGADLQEANLYGADLQEANLYGADLQGAKNTEIAQALTSILPEGELIGYKKLRNSIICKLRIPAEAKRSNATGRKCRAEYAIVLEGEGSSQYDKTFLYKVGETVRPTVKFDEDRWNECSSGIHFFITRWEAEQY